MNQLSYAIAAHETIRMRIISLEADIDEATLADTLEGLTDLHEVVAAVVRSALLDEAMVEGLKAHLEVLQERMRRITDRAAERRRIARDAMIEVDIRKITAPDFTISVREGSAALVVVDEQAIPNPYWIAREPRLDRIGLHNELKRGIPIEGVQLANPEPVLSVRVR